MLKKWVSGHSKVTGLVIYLDFLAKVAYLYYIILTAFKKKLASYCSKVYIWDPGDIYLNQKVKVSTCTFWARNTCNYLKNIYFFFSKYFIHNIITKLYSILLSEWIFWSKILKRKKIWNSMSYLRFLKYLWFLPGQTPPMVQFIMIKTWEKLQWPNHKLTVKLFTGITKPLKIIVNILSVSVSFWIFPYSK